jgi:hypothetical protein
MLMTIHTRDLLHGACRKVPHVEVAPSCAEKNPGIRRRGMEGGGDEWRTFDVERGKKRVRVVRIRRIYVV